MENILETRSLTKKYGDRIAVNGMSLHVRRGDIYGLIGKNGAGKTSLMKLLLGLTTPDSGEMVLLGERNADRARRKIGSLIEAPALYKNETAFENMKRFAILSPTSDADIRNLLNLVGLGNTGAKKAGAFSLGMRQRLGIAIALLGNPEVLILDEPINGLDPAGIKEIRDLIIELNRRGVTFLISSHLLDELGKIATRHCIGRCVGGRDHRRSTCVKMSHLAEADDGQRQWHACRAETRFCRAYRRAGRSDCPYYLARFRSVGGQCGSCEGGNPRVRNGKRKHGL